MCTPSRRTERDRAFDETLEREGFHVRRMADLTALEQDERYLEGTGSLVFWTASGMWPTPRFLPALLNAH